MKPRILFLITTAFIVGVIGAVSSFYLLNNAMKNAAPQSIGKARVGGPFTLTNHKGQRVTEKDFEGKFTLVYFGFTFCPDICPTELQIVTQALERLGKKAENVTPVFVTVDPERDSVEQMASYVSNFHERLVGLTGTPEEIRTIAKAYHVFYAKVKDNKSTTEYTVDHTSSLYFMGPKGNYLTRFTYGMDPQKMAEGIEKFL